MEKTEGNKLDSSSLNNKLININEIKKEEIKIRYAIFDNFKGILIFTVVFAHFLWKNSTKKPSSLSRKIVVFIYSFHMPGFIFISGFLTSKNSEKISNSCKLLILYYIFNFSYSIILHLYIKTAIGFFIPLHSYWYILSLFYWRISINFFYNFKFIFLISIIISLLVGYWTSFTNFLSIVRTFTYFPFFLLGYIITKSGKFTSFLKWRKNYIRFIIFCISFLFFLFLFIKYLNSTKLSITTLLMFSYNKKNTIKERIIMVIISFMMILFGLLLVSNIKIPLINKWGKNSLYIYLFHRLFTVIVDKELFSKTKSNNYIITYSFLFSLIILFIFGSDFVNRNCNYVLNSIHKNLL